MFNRNLNHLRLSESGPNSGWARWCNRLLDEIQRRTVTVGTGLRLRDDGLQGLNLSADPSTNGSQSMKVVQVVNDGGSAGDNGSFCSFTYSVWPLGADVDTDDPIATKVDVTCSRARGVKCAVDEASFGVAYRDSEGTLLLWDVDEVAQQTNC